ncbi:MAG TPA: Ig-like domain repeat protein [Terracidiphilus sp.]|nr:Ig-like domain repeat protein [Terracidiphilus sp.]
MPFLVVTLLSGALRISGQVGPQTGSSATVELIGNRVSWARPASDLGPVPPGQLRTRMLLMLRRSPKQESALRALLRDQQDVHSPQYHRWLTPEQFGAQFGAAPGDVDRVVAWLRTRGMTVAAISRGRQAIEFSATAGQIRQAFGTELHQYRVGTRVLVGNEKAPRIPAVFAPIIAGVDGLHDSVKQSLARVVHPWQAQATPLWRAPEFTDGSAQYLSIGDFWTIYNVVPGIEGGITGKGVTIGIAGRSDISSQDVARFRSTFLNSSYSGTFRQVVNGADPGTVAGDDLENTLDAEWAGALAPDAAVVLVVSASSGADGVDLSAEYLVDNNLADVVSVSYGLCEELLGSAENQFFAGLWEQAAAQGITVAVAAGDSGSAGCDDASSGEALYGLQVNGLASTPFDAAVGGTEFYNESGAWSSQTRSSPLPGTSALGYVPEEAWNEGPENGTLWAGSGGSSNCTADDVPFDVTGCSGGWPKPQWQRAGSGIPADGARDLPDVSFTAAVHDGYLVWIGGGMESVGGTSASTPSFAGVMALVNQRMSGRLGQPGPMLYQLAASQYGDVNGGNSGTLAECNAAAPPAAGNGCVFYDITAGSNAVACTGGSLNCSQSQPGTTGVLSGFAAGAGYDLATGLGSINVANLIEAWYEAAPHGAIPTVTTLTVSPAAATHGTPVLVSGSVSAQSGSGTPGGSVQIHAAAAPIATIPLTGGSFSSAISSFPGGQIAVTAQYSGSPSYAGSVSSAVQITIAKEPSTVSVAVSARDAQTGTPIASTVIPYGSNVILSGAVAGASGQGVPTGVLHLDAAGSDHPLTLDSLGHASTAVTALAPGAYSLSGNYGGDNSFNPGSSATSAVFNVVQAATSVTLAQGSPSGGNPTVIATVNSSSFGAPPSGSVHFTVNGTTAGTIAIQANASGGLSSSSATWVLPAGRLIPGANSVTAQYGGDANYLASPVSQPLPITGQKVMLTSPSEPAIPVSATVLKPDASLPVQATILGSFDSLSAEWAPGIHPASGWSTRGLTILATAGSQWNNQAVATWDTSRILSAGYYTIQVSVTDRGTTRAGTALVYLEPDLVPSHWPMWLAGVNEPDGYNALVPASSASGETNLLISQVNGTAAPPQVRVISADGARASALGSGTGSQFGPAAGHSGMQAGDDVAVPDGQVIHVFHPDGSSTDLEPLNAGESVWFFTQPAEIDDVDGDSLNEVVALGDGIGDQTWSGTAHLFDWRLDGSLLNPKFPVAIPDQNNPVRNFSPVRVLTGDVNGDGNKEFVVIEGTTANTFTPRLFATDGTPVAWNAPAISGYPSEMVLADLDHNGKLETILLTGDQVVHVLQPDGAERTGWPQSLGPLATMGMGNIAVGDLNRDGQEEICVSAGNLFVFHSDGTSFSTDWPTRQSANLYQSVVLADINGDGYPEIVAPLGINGAVNGDGYDSEQLVALDRFGNTVRSWNLLGAGGEEPWIEAWAYPTIGDFSGNGHAQIAVVYQTIDGATPTSHFVVTVLDTGAAYQPDANDWPMLYQNPAHVAVRRSLARATVSLQSSADPSIAGAPIEFTFAVQAAAPGSSTPGGQINLLDGSSNIGSCRLAAGACALSTTLSQGSHVLVAAYPGDGSYAPTTSAALALAVIDAGHTQTDTTVSASPASVLMGQSITLSAQVIAATGTPGGSVAFVVGSRMVGIAPISAGNAVLTNLAVTAANGFQSGTNTIGAAYSGDANFSPSSTTATVAAAYSMTAAPAFSVPPGTYSAAQIVTITDSTPAAGIYYTSDGSAPTAGSTPYTVPITVAASKTFQAIAIAPCCLPSPVASAAYTIGPPQTPAIAALSPVSAHAGAKGFALVVNGASLNSSASVVWNKTSLATQWNSATQLVAQVPASAIASPGAVTVTVQDGGNNSNSLQFEVDSSSDSTPSPTLLSTTATVTAGSAAAYPLTLPPAVSSLAVTCLNLPAGAQCAWSAATGSVTISTASSTPKGTYQVTFVFTETVSATLAGMTPFSIVLLLLARRRRRAHRFADTAALLAICLLMAACFTGCGAGAPASPPGTGDASAKQVTCAVAVNLIVQ